jgi:DNA polymerase-3 subunit epsilon
VWDWLKPREIVETRTRDDLAGDAIIRVTQTTRRIGHGPVPKLPNFVVAVDVETTGLHSNDRVVSLGAIWFATACLPEDCFPVSYIHLIFDPGKKSHPKAEQVHGFDDWTLRHQEPFADYATRIRDFLQAGDAIVAHNAEFDMGFIDRELVTAGQRPVDKPIYCTMEGYRTMGCGGSASLKSVCFEMGLQRLGAVHGALEDAWLALMVYLWLHGYEHYKPFNACGPYVEAFNLRPAPPRPEGAPPRRRSKRGSNRTILGPKMATPSESRSYRASGGRLYNAVLRTVSQLGYSIQHSDAAARTISFNTGMSMRSWAGQDMTITVIEDAEDASTIIIGGKRAQRGSIAGGGGQIYDWGERGKITRAFFEALNGALQQTPEPPQAKKPVQELSVDALERLVQMRESGALTEHEFQAAKSKLLNSDASPREAADVTTTRAPPHQQSVGDSRAPTPASMRGPPDQQTRKSETRSGTTILIIFLILLAALMLGGAFWVANLQPTPVSSSLNADNPSLDRPTITQSDPETKPVAAPSTSQSSSSLEPIPLPRARPAGAPRLNQN